MNQIDAILRRENDMHQYLDQGLRHILFVPFRDGSQFTFYIGLRPPALPYAILFVSFGDKFSGGGTGAVVTFARRYLNAYLAIRGSSQLSRHYQFAAQNRQWK